MAAKPGPLRTGIRCVLLNLQRRGHYRYIGAGSISRRRIIEAQENRINCGQSKEKQNVTDR